MELLYKDRDLVVAIKPEGVLSQEDERGRQNMPSLLREALGGDIFPIHRLDKETAGVMVFARHSKAAATLGSYIQDGRFQKSYLAVLTASPQEREGTFFDLLYYDRQKNKVFPVKRERKGVKKALLSYSISEERNGLCLVEVKPETGRTHQIRVQFASRKMPLYGDRKYGGTEGPLGLFCQRLSFPHPKTGELLSFSAKPEPKGPFQDWQCLSSDTESRL